MSSATSIRNAESVPRPDDGTSGNRALDLGATPADAGFRPWHFFVLASLMAATTAVILSRRSTPEHLIFISLTIGAVGAAAAAFYRTLAPLAAADASVFSETLSARSRARIEREKTLVLRSLKELEFDKAMGKLSARDFDEMGGRLRTRAIALMKQLDDEGAGYRTVIERELASRMVHRVSVPLDAASAAATLAAPDVEVEREVDVEPQRIVAQRTCASCGTVNDQDAAFCKRCGGKLA